MASQRISKPLLQAFHRYVWWYLRRNFHGVRVAKGGVAVPGGIPLIVCLNHPSWWDPLLALTLALKTFPHRRHYAAIDAEALRKYPFFERIGFFGVEAGASQGAMRFLARGAEVMQQSDAVLWLTAQGAFTDPRLRPTQLRGGIGHLARRVSRVAVVPLAIEYPFWEERYPEALAMWGEPIVIGDGKAHTAAEWTSRFASALEETQDRLGAESMRRNAQAFELVIGGSAGIGGVYDAWRHVISRLRGERFRAAHGAENL